MRLAKRARNGHIFFMLTKTELQERRALFAADGAKAMAEYLAEPEAIRVRTAYLTTLRLVRTAVEAAEKQNAVAIKKKVMKPRKRVLSPSHLPH